MDFGEFFKTATGGNSPYDYQCRLACGPEARFDNTITLQGGTDCSSRLIKIPTGLGKTAAVVLAWLWNRAHLQKSEWPRRLVYCLPMRTLVEQTRDAARRWIESLGGKRLIPGKLPRVIILMGGEELERSARDWDIYPEDNAILIGTQDMLLSRALNRGYGMSRYRWPMHFGLLNNDCLWVMDETQLMGVGVETSAQLDGFRHSDKMPTFGACPTWWMSATLEGKRLETVDHQELAHTEKLSDAEQTTGRPHELITASKKLSPAPLTLSSGTKDYAKELAELVKDRHQPGTLTLVIVNRVERARKIYAALTAAEKKSKQPLYDAAKVALIHSRFRPKDRARHEELLFGSGDRIVIATQAVEAGVDVSARLLITELAPWSSLIQRMGRCNRRADIPDAEVLWVDIESDAKGELRLPYTADELDRARTAISKPAPLTDASPAALAERGKTVVPEKIIRPVVRRRDLVDLFDTTPDICGQDLDISRYIRDGEDNDVQFFWRELDDQPCEKEPQPERDELCRVSIGDAMKFFKDKTEAWQWNPLEREWQKASRPRPGRVYLLATSSGGYRDDLGWTRDPKDLPTPHRPDTTAPEGHDDEPDTFDHFWQTLAEHTQFVVEQTAALATLARDAELAEALRTAALWHDIGKAHEEFQKMLRHGDATKEGTFWAKSENKNGRCNRHGFRHELASALAWLLADKPQLPGKPGSRERDLIAYLIAAHHGKVRLSIRSLPAEKGNPDAPDKLFARGIWEDDKVPPIDLGELKTPETALDLSFMQMGEGPHGPSWLARTVALRDEFGPFRLAYLETLLRAADARASIKPTNAP
ncbi:MAG TPA: CRISPR-associated helicase Cas3' [Verrucomicrobiae bacterium]|nr:CRISPR-associated helicase Cas3' [Verrucomicrobiae bacterium]